MAIKIERLGDHDRNNFSCEEEKLNSYIKERASQDQKNGFSQVYIAVDDNRPKEIIGFYTFSPSSVLRTDLPEEHIRKLPKYPGIPGYLIGRLARDQKYRGQGIGELLLIDALRKVEEANELASGNAVFVEAKNENAREFYKKYGFISTPNNENFLFLPIKSLKKDSPIIRENEFPSALSIIIRWLRSLFFKLIKSLSHPYPFAASISLIHPYKEYRQPAFPIFLFFRLFFYGLVKVWWRCQQET